MTVEFNRNLAMELYFTVAIALSIIGNVLVIFTIWRRMTLHRPSFFLVLNLAVGDLTSTLVITIFGMPNMFLQRWVYGNAACQFQGFMMQTVSFQTLLTIVFTAVDRYMAICRALRYKAIMTNKKCFLMMGYSWLHSVLVCLPPFFGWGTYTEDINSFSCMMKWDPEWIHRSYVIFTGVTTVFPSGIAIVVFYSKIYKEARRLYACNHPVSSRVNPGTSDTNGTGGRSAQFENKHNGKKGETNKGFTPDEAQRSDHENDGNGTTHNEKSPKVKETNEQTPCSNPPDDPKIRDYGKGDIKPKVDPYSVLKSELKALTVGLLVTIVFIITWTPFLAMRMIRLYASKYVSKQDWMINAEKITLVIFTSAAFINPVIYGTMNRQFRNEFIKALKSLKNMIN